MLGVFAFRGSLASEAAVDALVLTETGLSSWLAKA
jgi:hypothetical protein